MTRDTAQLTVSRYVFTEILRAATVFIQPLALMLPNNRITRYVNKHNSLATQVLTTLLDNCVDF